ncbi:hypothetical protein M758_6G196500 [Ceratodon purpureus]|nr:hypothetical protein M758_6G196500 [Ceratodon purpureus]
MDRALEESDARGLRDLEAFVNVSEHNSVPCFYSCTIHTHHTPATSRESLRFHVSLARRDSLAIESDCHNLDKKRASYSGVGAVNLLEAIRILVACPTLTHTQFVDSRLWASSSKKFDVLHGFNEDLMSEVFSLLKSSPSLSWFQFFDSEADVSLYCKHLQTLVCENPRLETLWVRTSGPNLVVLARALAVCLSRNTVLNSFTLKILEDNYELSRKSLKILLSPFTSSSPSEANADLKELALYSGYDPSEYSDVDVDVMANLVCRNTTLKKLDLHFSKFRSCLKDGKSSWREFCRALEVNQTLEELSCPCEVAALRELLVPFVPDRYGRQPNTTLSKLRLSVSIEAHCRRVEVLVNNFVIVLRDLASALQRNTTLKHVQFIFQRNMYGDYKRYDTKYSTYKVLCQAEPQIQEILRMMIDNELRVNTSLESLEVGHWSLLRVGTEWQTSYRGPCLRKAKEYYVKVKVTP